MTKASSAGGPDVKLPHPGMPRPGPARPRPAMRRSSAGLRGRSPRDEFGAPPEIHP